MAKKKIIQRTSETSKRGSRRCVCVFVFRHSLFCHFLHYSWPFSELSLSLLLLLSSLLSSSCVVSGLQSGRFWQVPTCHSCCRKRLMRTPLNVLEDRAGEARRGPSCVAEERAGAEAGHSQEVQGSRGEGRATAIASGGCLPTHQPTRP